MTDEYAGEGIQAPILVLKDAQLVADWLCALSDDYELDAENFDEDECAETSRAMSSAVRSAALELLRKARP